MSGYKTYAVFLCLIQLALSSSLTKFLVANGFKFVVLHRMGDRVLSGIPDLTYSQDIYVRWNVGQNYSAPNHQDFHLFLSDGSANELSAIVQNLHLVDVKRAMVFVPLWQDQDLLSQMDHSLSASNCSSFFYLSGLGSYVGNDRLALDRLEVFQVMKFPMSSRVVIQKIALTLDHQIIEDYNLNQVQLISTSLNWDPFIFFHSNGSSSGYLVDVMDILGEMFNFTYISQAHPSDDWGLDGDYLETPKGVLGSIIEGQADISLSTWVWILERDPFIDFAIILNDWQELCMVQNPLKVDLTLFFRPFTPDSWLAIGLTTITIVACSVGPMVIQHYNHLVGYQIMSTSGWYFFVLINTFYGGALTMFFANAPSMPFSTVEDVINAYPSWNFVLRSGTELQFFSKASNSGPELRSLFQRLQEDRESLLYDDLSQALERARGEQLVVHSYARMLYSHLTTHSSDKAGLQTFAKSRSIQLGLILPQRSPLLPVIKLGILRLRERGALEKLNAKWLGQTRLKDPSQDTMVLSGGQVIMVYLLMGAGYTICLLVLGSELVWRRMARTESKILRVDFELVPFNRQGRVKLRKAKSLLLSNI